MIDDAKSIPDLVAVFDTSAIRIAKSGRAQASDLALMLRALAAIANKNTPPSIILDIVAKAFAKVNANLNDSDDSA